MSDYKTKSRDFVAASESQGEKGGCLVFFNALSIINKILKKVNDIRERRKPIIKPL